MERFLNIRQATMDDAEKLQLYFSDIIQENLPTLFSRDSAPQTESWERFIGRHQANSLLLIAEIHSQTVGFLNFSQYDRPQCTHSGDVSITTKKQWRSQGIGQQLIATLLQWANQNPVISRIELEVFANNPAAIHLYQKNRFQIEGVKRNAVLVNGELIDSIQMAWLKATPNKD